MQIEMWAYWIRVGPNSMIGGELGHREDTGRIPCEDGGRN